MEETPMDTTPTHGRRRRLLIPLAAIAGSRDVMSVLDARARPRAEVVWATNTLNGNPVCAAAGLRQPPLA